MAKHEDIIVEHRNISKELGGVVDGDVFGDIFTRIAYSTDASIYQIVPECVVCPKSADDVVAVVKFAAEHDIAVAGRGAGSGVAGESLSGGIVVDFRRYMNRIIGMRDHGTKVVCQPGVVLADLNNYLAKFGKKIGPDPSSGNRAVIGGVVANNATGAHSLQYGYIADYVAALQTVLADGSLVDFENGCDPDELDGAAGELAKRCLTLLVENGKVIADSQPATLRNRSGYNVAGICVDGKIDIARLLTGSEGTLGLFTEITLQTVDLPKAKGLLQLEFASFEDMARAVPVIVDGEAAACELMDRKVMDVALETLTHYRDIFPAGCECVLLVEQIGDDEEQVRGKIEKCIADVGELSCGMSTFFDSADQLRIWKSRKDAVPLLGRKRCAARPIPFIEDVSVDNRRLGEYIRGMTEIGNKYGIVMAFYGHAGDGELHIRPYLDLADSADVEKMKNIADDVFTLAWSLGGTISGEHADGLVRAAFIRRQYGDEYYEILKSIKNIFDPRGVLNPGKVVNDDPGVMTSGLSSGNRPDLSKAEKLYFEKGELGIELGLCSGCGVCTSTQKGGAMCPVYRALAEEVGCSRAKVNLIRAWLAGLIEDKDLQSDEFKRIMSLCVNCKRCKDECPSGVDVSKLMIEARARIAETQGYTLTERVLAHNRLLSLAGSKFAPISNLFMPLPIFKRFLEIFTKLDHRRAMPSFAGGSFIEKGRKHLGSLPPISKPVDKVAYFTDTYAAYNDHELGFAVIDTLYYNDIEVIIPDQRPAPLPAMVYGDLKTAREDLGYIVGNLARAVKDGYKIICSEPSAALFLTEELRLLVDSEDAKLVSENTFELMGYLAGLNTQGKLKPVGKRQTDSYAYHTPCHLAALGNESAGAELVRKLTGADVIEINAGCCGLSGTFGMQTKNYDLSLEIGRTMADEINAADAGQAMTECAACKMQIEHLTGKTAVHPIKVLAVAYGI